MPLRGNVTLHTSCIGKCKTQNRTMQPVWGGELLDVKLEDELCGTKIFSGDEEGNGATVTFKGIDMSGCNLFPGSKVKSLNYYLRSKFLILLPEMKGKIIPCKDMHLKAN